MEDFVLFCDPPCVPSCDLAFVVQGERKDAKRKVHNIKDGLVKDAIRRLYGSARDWHKEYAYLWFGEEQRFIEVHSFVHKDGQHPPFGAKVKRCRRMTRAGWEAQKRHL